MWGRPASRLADFAKELGKQKLRSYSPYKTLKDLKMSASIAMTKKIPQFVGTTRS
jgi:hypothetical protein